MKFLGVRLTVNRPKLRLSTVVILTPISGCFLGLNLRRVPASTYQKFGGDGKGIHFSTEPTHFWGWPLTIVNNYGRDGLQLSRQLPDGTLTNDLNQILWINVFVNILILTLLNILIYYWVDPGFPVSARRCDVVNESSCTNSGTSESQR